MAAKRQVIKKIERVSLADFDEQLWPINMVLLVLAGFVAGVILATSRFQGGPWWQNGWFRLALLVLTVSLLIGGSIWLHRKKHVRRMQLAVLLSLMLNLCIQTGLYVSYMPLKPPSDTDQPSEWLDEETVELTIPDYGRDPSQPVDVTPKPVETQTREQPVEQVERQETKEPTPPQEKPPVPDPPQTVQQPPTPQPLERAETAVSTPRQSSQPAGVRSRQASKTPLPPQETIANNERPATERPPTTSSQVEAQVSPAARQQPTTAQVQPRPPVEEVQPAPTPVTARTTPTQPRTSDEQPTVAPTPRSTANRQAPTPPTVPNQPAAEPTRPVASESPTPQPSQLQPTTTQVARQTARPEVKPTPQQPTESPATSATQPQPSTLAARTPTSESRPEVTAPAANTPTRRTATAQLPESSSLPESQPTTVAANASPTTLQPATVQSPSRQSSQAPSTAAASTATSAPASTASPQVVARAQPRRAEGTAAADPNVAMQAASAAARSATSTAVAQVSGAAQASEPASAASGSPSAAAATQASAQTAVSRAATAAPATAATAGMSAAAAIGSPNAAPAQAQLGRAASSSSNATPSAGPPTQQVARASSATNNFPGTAGAEAAAPALEVAQSGGQPTPSSNSQATTAGRNSGSMPLPRGAVGAAQTFAGEAANSSSGLTAALPQRAASTSDAPAKSTAAGSGPLARSQSPAPAGLPGTATAEPDAAVPVAAGGGGAQPSAQPAASKIGVARASGSAPTVSAAETGSGELPAGIAQGRPAASQLSRAATGDAGSSGPQVAAQAAPGAIGRTTSGPAIPAGPIAADEPTAVASGGSGGQQTPNANAAGSAANVARTSTNFTGSGAAAGGSSAPSATGPQGAVAARLGQGRASEITEDALSGAPQAGSVGRSTSAVPIATTAAIDEGPAESNSQPGSSAGPAAQAASAAMLSQRSNTGSGLPQLAGEPGANVPAGTATKASAASLAAARTSTGDAAPSGAPVAVAGSAARARGPAVAIAAQAVEEGSGEPAEAAPVGGVPGAVASTSPGSAGVQRSATSLPGNLLGRVETQADEGGGAEVAPQTALAGGPRTNEGDEAGPTVTATASSTPGRRTLPLALPSGAALADEAGPVSGDPGASEVALAGTTDPSLDNVARQSGGMLPVQIAAVEGPGGLDNEPLPQVGIPSRLARRDSEVVHNLPSRFQVDRKAGLPLVDSRILDSPTDAYQQRAPEKRQENSHSQGGTAGTERAVELGLDYLARQQLPDGRWSLQQVAGGQNEAVSGAGNMQADTAATGLALLCFLGAGYTHVSDKHRDTVSAGLAYLLANQKSNGDLFHGGSKYVWFYSHGIASIALCEAYGMTGDPQLKEPAQKALDFIIASQHPADGGWRYAPQTGTDTSVSGWQIMALKSGELAGLEVSSETYAKAVKWLDTAQAAPNNPASYRYRPGSEIKHQRDPSLAMTAEALLMRMYTGWDRNHPGLTAGANYLRQNLPTVGTATRPQRDAYYWYYATQVMFQLQGEHWAAWNERLRAMLLSTQAQAGPLTGSWDPRGPVSDRWGVEAGRLYVTSMHLLMLEVYYRHLPLYKDLKRGTP